MSSLTLIKHTPGGFELAQTHHHSSPRHGDFSEQMGKQPVRNITYPHLMIQEDLERNVRDAQHVALQ